MADWRKVFPRNGPASAWDDGTLYQDPDGPQEGEWSIMAFDPPGSKGHAGIAVLKKDGGILVLDSYRMRDQKEEDFDALGKYLVSLAKTHNVQRAVVETQFRAQALLRLQGFGAGVFSALGFEHGWGFQAPRDRFKFTGQTASGHAKNKKASSQLFREQVGATISDQFDKDDDIADAYHMAKLEIQRLGFGDIRDALYNSDEFPPIQQSESIDLSSST